MVEKQYFAVDVWKRDGELDSLYSGQVMLNYTYGHACHGSLVIITIPK